MSGFDPLASDRPGIVYVDIKSPYAFLAVEPTFELEDELGIELDWRPLTLDIPSYLGSARLGDDGQVVESERSEEQWALVRYAYRDCRRYASVRGLQLRGTVKIWDTLLVHIAFLWAKRQGHAALRRYLRALYPPFWRREVDVEDVAVVQRLMAEAGVELAGYEEFMGGVGSDEHDEMQAAIFDAGIFGVPSFVVDGELYFGREHLPLVRWHLRGRRGSAPDIGYRRMSSSAGGGVARSNVPSTPSGIAGEPIEKLSFVFDVCQEESYFAFEPTIAAANALGLELEWWPYTEAPPATPGQGPSRTERHMRRRASYRQLACRRTAERLGLPFGRIGAADSNFVNATLLWARDRLAAKPGAVEALVREMLRSIWQGQLDVGDDDAVLQRLVQLGLECDDFDTDRALAALRSSRRMLRQRGVVRAPGYLLEGEFFHGREHLPMVRWIVGGRSGPGPL